MRVLRCVVLLPLFVAAVGCPRTTTTKSPAATSSTAQKEDLLSGVLEALGRGADTATCRGVVQQLNSHLTRAPESQPAALSDAERAVLQTRYNLDKDELAEVESRNFTLLDAHYLDQTLLFRDVAVAMGLRQLPPLERAKAAFAWTQRQLQPHEGAGEVTPTHFALLRGWGTSLDQSLTFLALLEQCGLEGCLLAAPTADGKGFRYWGVGVVHDKDLLVFDPRLGLPIPGPDGREVATLAELCTRPELLQALRVDDKLTYDVTPEQLKQTQAFFAGTLSSLAPRMRYLQALATGNEPIYLGKDPVAALQHLEAALKRPETASIPVRVASAAGDPNAPVGNLRAYLPPEEGGIDKSGRLLHTLAAQVPMAAYPPILAGLSGEPGERLKQHFAKMFLDFFSPGHARDLVLHGRLSEATTQLVEIRDQARTGKKAREIPLAKLEQQVADWCVDARDSYAQLLRAERGEGGPDGLSKAKSSLDGLWKTALPVQTLIRLAAADPQDALATYQLALSKHEDAVRAQLRAESTRTGNANLASADAARAQEAWRSTAGWWETYLEDHPTQPQAVQARRLRAEALAASGDTAGAVTLLQDDRGEIPALQKLGRALRMRQLKKS